MQGRGVLETIFRIFFFFYVIFYGFLYLGYFFLVGLLHSSYSIISIPAVIEPYLFLLSTLWGLWIGKTAEEKQNAKNRYLAVVVYGLIPVVLIMVILGMNEVESSFDHDHWLNKHDRRVYMVDDLLQNYQLQGMSHADMVRLLGDPDET